MRITRRIGAAAVAIAAVSSSPNAAVTSSPDASAPVEEKDSAQIWFERALSLDIGDAGAPDAVQAFAAMRRAADLGNTQAEFNVAAMLDSGRGAPRDGAQASIWYARAAPAGNRRAAFNLGQLYESGEGVPSNADLARAWYAAAGLPAARERIGEVKSPANRPASVRSPEPIFPLKTSALEPGSQQVDLVWTSAVEPEAAREAWSGFVDVSSVHLPLPAGAENFAWRVSAVARGLANYAVSGWSVFAVPPS